MVGPPEHLKVVGVLTARGARGRAVTKRHRARGKAVGATETLPEFLLPVA